MKEISPLDRLDQSLPQRIAELEYRLARDGLTGARSRDYFLRHFDGYATSGGALFFLDIDNFKSVNDHYGHLAGDELLLMLVNSINSVLGPDDFIARIGGDEFVILTRQSDPENVRALGEAVLRACQQAELTVGELTVSRAASIGYLKLRPGLAVHNAIDMGDTAMRCAKNLGKNQVHCLSVEDDTDELLLPSVDELRLGLQRSEVGYHLQPIFCTHRNQIAGYEALLRWERPNGQVLPPAQFLETMTQAYSASARPPLEFAREATEWVTMHEGRFCCFNISMAFLKRIAGGSDAWVEEIIGNSPRNKIIFEITESAIESEVEASAESVNALRESGIRIALDDFGTGASNLERLQTMQVDMVKIDRRFVRGADTDLKTRNILQGMIDIAHQAGAVVVCEGIEDETQYKLVTDLGAELAQGFLLGKPEPHQRSTETAPA
ncbi:MAG: bifunctional diguanylate cyclase/phosphodiesterase [Rhodobacteraceae bacterium]|nr:bifunctional diguanylate cyclase/phosphodiesterase [Paracoccaceae bacterium]